MNKKEHHTLCKQAEEIVTIMKTMQSIIENSVLKSEEEIIAYKQMILNIKQELSKNYLIDEIEPQSSEG